MRRAFALAAICLATIWFAGCDASPPAVPSTGGTSNAGPAGGATTAMDHVQEDLEAAESFPFDFELTDVDGKSRKLSDYRGKVVIVDFWGTWCPPCREEIPSFIRLQDTYLDQGLRIVGINYEHAQGEEAAEKVRGYMEKAGINYPCALGDPETQSQVPNFRGYPTTLFIDRAGKVRLMVVGLHKYEYLDGVVSTLLAEQAPASAE